MAHARFGGSVGAAALLEQALHGGHRLGSYVAVGLVTGLRTEELRVLRWRQVDLDAGTVLVTRADRFGGDTKTTGSRSGLRLADLAVRAPAHRSDRPGRRQTRTSPPAPAARPRP
ncbi:hypothetical protein GCM10009735_75530 [Actinomadura chokoriensis]